MTLETSMEHVHIVEKNHQAKDCHFKDARCLGNTTTPRRQHSQQTNYVEKTLASNADISIFQVHDKQMKLFTVDLCIQGSNLMFEIDTGAAVTLISEETYRKDFPIYPHARDLLIMGLMQNLAKPYKAHYTIITPPFCKHIHHICALVV